MSGRKYQIYDVFTDRKLAGNPLAIVLDAHGLETEQMQAITREFDLSETVFVSAPKNESHAASIRIFTPLYELPFAGHPTVGTAIALAEAKQEMSGDAAQILVLEEKIGDIRCIVTSVEQATFAEFDIPKLSNQLEFNVSNEDIANALGLEPHQIGFDNHQPAQFSAGVPYVTVPVANLEAIENIRFDSAEWRKFSPLRDGKNSAAPYIYCRETVSKESSYHARMFVPGPPSWEDPATGSAAAAFSGAVCLFEQPSDGLNEYWIEQGIEMGRPSRIRLEIDALSGSAAATRIGGNAIKVAEGVLLV